LPALEVSFQFPVSRNISRSEELDIPNVSTSLVVVDTVVADHIIRIGRVGTLDTTSLAATDVGGSVAEEGHHGALAGEGVVLTTEDVPNRLEGVGVVQDVVPFGRSIRGLAEQLGFNLNHGSRDVVGEAGEDCLRVFLAHLDETGDVESWMRHVETLREGENLDELGSKADALDITSDVTLRKGSGDDATHEVGNDEGDEGKDDCEGMHLGGPLKKVCQNELKKHLKCYLLVGFALVVEVLVVKVLVVVLGDAKMGNAPTASLNFTRWFVWATRMPSSDFGPFRGLWFRCEQRDHRSCEPSVF
jgi:hypothetical protein